MAKTALGGTEVNTVGDLPAIGSDAPDFLLTKPDMSDVSLANYHGQKVVLNIYPSIDTGICAASTKRFNEEASNLQNTRIICVSRDLPFAFARYCEAEGISNLDTLSCYRDGGAFGKAYGVELADGAFKGLNARAIVVINEEGKVTHTELVPEIGTEPNYEAALNAL